MTEFNNDLLIHDNPADLILSVTALNYDDTEKEVTLLFNSCDDWSSTVDNNEIIQILGFWGSMVIVWLQQDINIKCLLVSFHQIIKGQSQELGRLRPFVRDGKRYRKGIINRDGTITFDDRDEL